MKNLQKYELCVVVTDRGIATFSEVSSFDGLVKLGYRALGIILKQVF